MPPLSGDLRAATCGTSFDEVLGYLLAAENEIAAYYAAVLNHHGQKAADWAFEDWIRRVDEMTWPPLDNSVSWRQITIQSMSLLADVLGHVRDTP